MLPEWYLSVQQDCNSANKLAWTNNNALPCGDNVACTKNDQCSNGVCSGTPFTCLPCEECHSDTCHVKPGFCAINDGGTRKCFNGGALRPGYSCQVKKLSAAYIYTMYTYTLIIFVIFQYADKSSLRRMVTLIVRESKSCSLLKNFTNVDDVRSTIGRIKLSTLSSTTK